MSLNEKAGFRRNTSVDEVFLLKPAFSFDPSGCLSEAAPRNKDGQSEITPWRVDYESYNDPERNAFFKVAPEIPQRA